MIEERLGLAQISDDLTWGPHEKRVDLVAAIGMASTTQHTKLGALILRVYVGNDPKAFTEAKKLLAQWVCLRNRKIAPKLGDKLAYRALTEIVAPGCVRCTGTGEDMQDDKKIVCPACRGSGRHTFKAEERAKSLGMKMDRYREVGENWLQMAIDKAAGAYSSVVRGAAKRR